MSTDNQKEYELFYFTSVALEPEAIKNIKTKISEIITKHQGVVVKEEEIGKKKLAYMIKHTRHGYYVLNTFKVNPAKTNVINQEIELMPEILRHKIVTKEYIKPIIFKENSVESKTKKIVTDEKSKKTTPVIPPEAAPKEETPIDNKAPATKKVDIAELDRKIDELLSEHDV